MVQRFADATPELYLRDETAWLEATAELVRGGRLELVDTVSLAEYLTDMAKRDRREVRSRLAVLLHHLLKWHFQPAKRTKSWQRTVIVQRHELDGAIGEGGVLRAHADEVLTDQYAEAVRRAAADTGLPRTTFPATCPWTVEQLLSADLLNG